MNSFYFINTILNIAYDKIFQRLKPWLYLQAILQYNVIQCAIYQLKNSFDFIKFIR